MKDGREFDDEAHETTDIGRRRFVQGSVASAAGMLLSQHLSAADAGAAKAAASLPGGKRPNFLILMCDENRFPPVYESPQVKDYRSTFLQTQNLLRANGVEFLRHYAAPSVACTPSRASIYTGQYPSLLGRARRLRRSTPMCSGSIPTACRHSATISARQATRRIGGANGMRRTPTC